jgi:hypothetical protein
MAWDFKQQLQMTQRQAAAGPAEKTYYVYGMSGQRARKVTERANGTRRTERIYPATRAQVELLAGAADQPVIYLAGDNTMLAAHNQVMSMNPTVWWARRAQTSQGVVGYRNAIGSIPMPTPSGSAPLMPGLEFHHFSYPRAVYPNQLMDPQNIFIMFPLTHTQIHAPFGGT